MRVFFKRIERQPLNKTIFLFTTITIISIVLLFVISISIQIKSIYLDNTKATTEQNVGIISTSVSNFIDNIEDNILRCIIHDDILSNLNNYYENKQGMVLTELYISRFMHQTINTNSSILGSDILLTNGEMLNTSQFFKSEVDTLVNDINNNTQYQPYQWVGPYTIKQLNGVVKDVLVVQKRIIDLNTSFDLGIIYIYIDESYVSELFEKTNYNDTEFFLLDSNNNILSNSKGQVIDTVYIEELVDKKTNLEIDGNFLTYNQLGDFKIITSTPMASLTKSLNTMFLYVVIFCIIAVLGALVISKVISAYISKPINDLAKTIGEIIDGNRTIRADDAENSEVNMLNQSFNKLMDTNEDLISEVYQNQESIRQYEFSILQEQINPHFLYNTLSTISSLVKLDKKEEAVKTISSFAKFYRKSLSNGSQIITIKDELDIIKEYLEIQRCRYQNLFNINISAPENILQNSIPKLTLQPIIENAIYHGIKTNNKKAIINIDIQKIDQVIYIDVRDSGVGIRFDKLIEINKNINIKNDKHFGLTCVNQRIKLICGDKYGILLESDGSTYTKVRISIPKDCEV